jgi:hypothetical protein
MTKVLYYFPGRIMIKKRKGRAYGEYYITGNFIIVTFHLILLGALNQSERDRKDVTIYEGTS